MHRRRAHWYACAHTAAVTAALPQQTQAPALPGRSSSGRQRIVAELSSLTRTSHSLRPHQVAATNPAAARRCSIISS
jgi:hypothetical protein